MTNEKAQLSGEDATSDLISRQEANEQKAEESLLRADDNIASKGDVIYKQDAIDAIRASALKYTGFMEMEMYTDYDAVEAIAMLPSTQPEIIRCKDCIYFDRYVDGIEKYQWDGFCTDWARNTYEDWFCSRAERRTYE